LGRWWNASSTLRSVSSLGFKYREGVADPGLGTVG
jgi:hypothetical protein